MWIEPIRNPGILVLPAHCGHACSWYAGWAGARRPSGGLPAASLPLREVTSSKGARLREEGHTEFGFERFSSSRERNSDLN